MIFIQWVIVQWTKKSRGAPGATYRNAVPEGFPTELDQPLDNNGRFIQQVNVYETSLFKTPYYDLQEGWTYNQLRDDIRLEFEQNSNQLQVHYWGIIGLAAYHRSKHVFNLNEGEYGRVVANKREVVGEYITHYEKHVYNIFFGESLDSQRFANQKPNYSYRDEKDLW